AFSDALLIASDDLLNTIFPIQSMSFPRNFESSVQKTIIPQLSVFLNHEKMVGTFIGHCFVWLYGTHRAHTGFVLFLAYIVQAHVCGTAIFKRVKRTKTLCALFRCCPQRHPSHSGFCRCFRPQTAKSGDCSGGLYQKRSVSAKCCRQSINKGLPLYSANQSIGGNHRQ